MESYLFFMEGPMSIKNFASALIVKVIVGLVLVATTVISIVYFLQLYHEYLAQFSNGALIETSTYSVILIGSVVGLYFLLIDKNEKKSEKSISSLVAAIPLSMNVESLGLQFLDGFMNGLTKKKTNNPTTF